MGMALEVDGSLQQCGRLDTSVSDTSRAPEGPTEKSTAFEPNPDCSAHVIFTLHRALSIVLLRSFPDRASHSRPEPAFACIFSALADRRRDARATDTLLVGEPALLPLMEIIAQQQQIGTSIQPSTIRLDHTALSTCFAAYQPPQTGLQTSLMAHCGLLCASTSDLCSTWPYWRRFIGSAARRPAFSGSYVLRFTYQYNTWSSARAGPY
ncbi:uncharacterized protein SCHCODRAFT_02373127 [Schizophyllum commune H4-8]|uniref:uncharacterized protein n=1 Tax=Schizophyllum commune (strain H4-8 / FGSC 9210) TaxID=578458 RepID=UPI00215EE746|nr:uncharacterized protein SCHCODRAFT_02373127 [Schizophyllum commune H4-8]KAI5889644.1 hypothetical protein SCHCODRAFT_02373127 [Schizophyllum commune H4-8]